MLKPFGFEIAPLFGMERTLVSSLVTEFGFPLTVTFVALEAENVVINTVETLLTLSAWSSMWSST